MRKEETRSDVEDGVVECKNTSHDKESIFFQETKGLLGTKLFETLWNI